MSQNYYFYYERDNNKGVAALLNIPKGLSTESWGALQKGLEAIAEPNVEKRKFGYLYSLKLYPDQSFSGGNVFWHSELAGSSGARYIIMPMPGCSNEVIALCKNHIKTSFDAVGIQTLKADEWIQAKAESLLGKVLNAEVTKKQELEAPLPNPEESITAKCKTI